MIEEVGKQLQQARKDQEITLEQASEELHIRVRFLKALENGDLSVLPSAVQVRGFLRIYAEFLGLDADKLLGMMQQNESQEPDEADASTPEVDAESLQAEQTAKMVTEIFEEIGFAIHQRRELLGLSIEDIEEHTHIPAHYLEYLEKGQFDSFPSPVQARGMLGNYVNFLEMDTNAVLLRYAEALQAGLAARQGTLPASDETGQVDQAEEYFPPEPRRSLLPIWVRSVFSVDTFLIGGVGIAVILITIWGIVHITQTIAEAVPQPTAPALAQVLAPSATPQPSPTGTLQVTPTLQLLDIGAGEDTAPTAIPTIPISSQANIQLYVIARQRTYLRVTVDGTVTFDGRAAPGANLTFTGDRMVEVLTGNAAALQIFYNDQDLGSLGIVGQVLDVVFTPDGMISPTATPAPTVPPEEAGTQTPEPSITPNP